MFSPIELPPPSTAPRFPASIMPGPPPVTTANPASVAIFPNLRASSHHFAPGGDLVEPKNETVFLKSAKNCQPSTNSESILNTRQCNDFLKSSPCLGLCTGNFDAGKFICPFLSSSIPLEVCLIQHRADFEQTCFRFMYPLVPRRKNFLKFFLPRTSNGIHKFSLSFSVNF